MLARAEREAKRRAFSGVERAGAMRMGGEGRGAPTYSGKLWSLLLPTRPGERRGERRERLVPCDENQAHNFTY